MTDEPPPAVGGFLGDAAPSQALPDRTAPLMTDAEADAVLDAMSPAEVDALIDHTMDRLARAIHGALVDRVRSGIEFAQPLDEILAGIKSEAPLMRRVAGIGDDVPGLEDFADTLAQTGKKIHTRLTKDAAPGHELAEVLARSAIAPEAEASDV
jgi:hypothetical protein